MAPLKNKNGFFPPHFLPEMVEKGLRDGTLASGTLRINPKSYEDAFVTNVDPGGGSGSSGLPDYYIEGIRNRNRALHGDEVVLDFFDKSKWKVLEDRIEVYLASRPNPDEDLRFLCPERLKTEENLIRILNPEKSTESDEDLRIQKTEKKAEAEDFRIRNPEKEAETEDLWILNPEKLKAETEELKPNPDEDLRILNPEKTTEELKKKEKSTEKEPNPDEDLRILKAGTEEEMKKKEALEAAVKSAEPWGTDPVKMDTKWDIADLPNGSSNGSAEVAIVNLISVGDPKIEVVIKKKKTRRGHRGHRGQGGFPPITTTSAMPFSGGVSTTNSTSTVVVTSAISLGSLKSELDLILTDKNPTTKSHGSTTDNPDPNYKKDPKTKSPKSHHSSTTDPNSDPMKKSPKRSTDNSDYPKHKLKDPTKSHGSTDNSNPQEPKYKLTDPTTKSHGSTDPQDPNYKKDPTKNHGSTDPNPQDPKYNLKDPTTKSHGSTTDPTKSPKSHGSSTVNPDPKYKLKDPTTKNHGSSTDRNPKYKLKNVLKHPDWKKFVQITARVVYIKEKRHSRKAVGSLRLMKDKNPKFAFFSPNDSRIPRMKIPMIQAPPNFFNRSSEFRSTLFVAEIRSWDEVASAIGTLIKILGSKSDLEAQSEGILLSNGIFDVPFEFEVDENPKIPDEELKSRRDLRSECVFTIDPLTARDLDDALSVEKISSSDLYRVGVHIADVSYFVKESTDLDKEALKRGTSVYLVEKVVPMLPRPLCENLCSLNPGQDRLTFSIEWILSESGEISDIWFGKSVIRSAAKLAYEHAQSVIENLNPDFPPIQDPWTKEIVSEKIRILRKIAGNLKKKRGAKGALKLDQPKVCFSLDPDSGFPDRFRVYEQKEAHSLIEEFMLLANVSVAEKILDSFPDLAVLRYHPNPKPNMMDSLSELMALMGVAIDTSSSKSLQESLLNYKNQPEKFQVLVALCSKPMDLAKYFCAGIVQEPEKRRHYALSVATYSHFTSPIRRYPDILVHRLLEAALNGEAATRLKESWNKEAVHAMANHCNTTKQSAKEAGAASIDLYMAVYICKNGPFHHIKAAVVEVKDHSVDVIILEMGITKRVYMDRLENLESCYYETAKGIKKMTIIWKNKVKSMTLTLFSEVFLTLKKNEEKELDFLAIIEPPPPQ